MTYEDFAKLIKKKRDLMLITQKEASYHLAIHPSIYNRIENGKQEPTFSQLQRICDFFEFNLTEILKMEKPNQHKSYD